MTRTSIALASPIALALGMLLAHCSSSSSPANEPIDSGTTPTKDSGTGIPSTGTGSGTPPGSGTSVSPGSGSASGSGSSPTSGTGSSSGSSSGSGSSPAVDSGTPTDTYDAGPCVGPAGGETCDPGNVECNNTQCAVPGHTCCNDSTPVCQAVTATCGSPQNCDEKSDCPDGQICCLAATSFTAFSITCQTGPTCPSSLGSAQICKTNAECGAGGTCTVYNCGSSGTTEACTNPSTITCTAM